MLAEITPLGDVVLWLRGNGLEIVLLVLGAVLLGRFVAWVRDRVTDRLRGDEHESAWAALRRLRRRMARESPTAM